MDATQDHPLITKERSASIGDGTPPKSVEFPARPRKNSLPTYDKTRIKKNELGLLEGERIASKVPHVSLLRKGEIAIIVPRGDLYLTNYELIYKPTVAAFKKNGVYYVQKNNAISNLHINSTTLQQQIIRNLACEEIRISLLSINYCRKKSGQDLIKIKTYDMRELRFTFSILEHESVKFLASAIHNASALLLPASPSINLATYSSTTDDIEHGDIDLDSSFSHLHTQRRTIGGGKQNGVSNNSYSNLNNNSSGNDGKLAMSAGMSAAKVAEKVFEYIMKYANLQNATDLFAYHHKLLPAPDQSMDGWFIYDPIKEFTRMGIPDAGWTISGVNNSYELCPTYPPFLAIPRAMSDPVLLRKCAEFRSKGRLPTLCWKSPNSPGTITRCSQPLVGYQRARCPEDEMLVAKILELNPTSDELYIVDARPKVNALANQAGGEGGWESGSAYKSCKILFMNLENIHIVRDSFNKLFALINQQGSQVSWESDLDGSGWLRHIRAIMLAAREVTSTISLGKSVMIHCSDGWDRTALLSSLAQLCLDPYYRSTRGFQILIEKEWLSFGHKFGDRAGHSEGQKITSSEKSPVFLQFLDCVFQLVSQFPTSFQFSVSLLVFLADQVYSSRFGTFLCNSDCERMRQSISSRTVSIWTYINANLNQFVNPFYDERGTSSNTLFPSCSSQSIVLFSPFFLRYHHPFSASKNTSIPLVYGPRIPLDGIKSVFANTENEEELDNNKKKGMVRGTVAFLSKPSLNVYPLVPQDTFSWSPMELIEKRAREMAIQIQQLENELQSMRKTKAKGGNFTEYTSYLRFPKPSPSLNKQSAYLEAKNTIELILLRTFETIAVKQKRARHGLIQIGGRTTSSNSIAPNPPSTSHSLASSSNSLSPPTSPRTISPSSSASSTSSSPTSSSPSSPTNSRSPPHANTFSNFSSSHAKPPPAPKTRSLSDNMSASLPIAPPPWRRDSVCSCCEMCGRGFTKVWRKHHCRSCGMIFCANCSKRKIPIPNYQYFHPVRVCDQCYVHLARDN